jgi:hypothetical protein
MNLLAVTEMSPPKPGVAGNRIWSVTAIPLVSVMLKALLTAVRTRIPAQQRYAV